MTKELKMVKPTHDKEAIQHLQLFIEREKKLADVALNRIELSLGKCNLTEQEKFAICLMSGVNVILNFDAGTNNIAITTIFPCDVIYQDGQTKVIQKIPGKPNG